MGHLRDTLLHPTARGQLIGECEALVGEEVAAKSGLTGIAIKAAYAAVTRLGPGFVAKAIDRKLLDPFVDGLEPFYLAAEAAKTPFDVYLPAHAGEVANALLAVTDRAVAAADNVVVQKTYNGLRRIGVKHVEQAVPNIGRLVARRL